MEKARFILLLSPAAILRVMEIRADFLELAQRVGIDLVDHVTARDELYLRPEGLTRVAARRFRAGLRSLAAYLRRLILLLALQMEHGLVERGPVPVRENRPKWPYPRGFRVLAAPYRPDIYTSHTPNPQAGASRNFRAPILGGAGSSSGMWALDQGSARSLEPVSCERSDTETGKNSLERDPSRRRSGSRAPVPSADLFAALDTMLALLKAPEARARRVAWHLARRVDFVAIPDFGYKLRLRLATEAQVIFGIMAKVIQTANGARPPPLGPPPRPPPRLRRV